MGNRGKYNTNPIDMPSFQRTLCLPFLNLSVHATQIHVHYSLSA